MFNHKTLRLSSLLLAVGLLLGLVATGCSDKDRDGWSEDKTTTFDYVYEVATSKVAKDAQFVVVSAFNEDGKILAKESATLTSNKVEDHLKEDGKYYATTTVKSGVSSVVYNFYHEVNGAKISDGVFNMGVVDVKDGKYDATNDKPMEFSVAIVNIKTGKPMDTPVKLKVGDGIAVEVSASHLGDVSGDVKVETDDDILRHIDGLDNYVWKYVAVKAGAANIDVRYQKVPVASMPVTVSCDAQLLLCPKGYYVEKGALYDEHKKLANPTNLPDEIVKSETEPAFVAGDEYTFFVAYLKDDGTVEPKTADDVTLVSKMDAAEFAGLTMTVKDQDCDQDQVTAELKADPTVKSNPVNYDIDPGE